MIVKNCPCGKPLHYTDSSLKDKVDALVDKLGELMQVTVGNNSYMVSRHYIALHGLKGNEIEKVAEELKFRKVK